MKVVEMRQLEKRRGKPGRWSAEVPHSHEGYEDADPARVCAFCGGPLNEPSRNPR